MNITIEYHLLKHRVMILRQRNNYSFSNKNKVHKRSKNTSQEESKSFKHDMEFTRHESNVHHSNRGEQLPSSLLGLKFDIICCLAKDGYYTTIVKIG